MSYVETDVGEAIQILDERLYEVEMVVTGPDVMTGPVTNEFPSGIKVGDGSGVGDPAASLRTVSAAVAPPTALALVAGDIYDNVYVDSSWSAPTGAGSDQTTQYEVEMAKKVGGIYQSPRSHFTSSLNYRLERLDPDSTYGVRVWGLNKIGQRSATPAGDAANSPSNYRDVNVGHDTTIPGAVTGVTLTAAFRSLVISWNDLVGVDTGGGKGAYRVQVASNSTFTADVETKIISGTIVAFGPYATGTTRFARVQAIDVAGNDGPWTNSAPTSVTTVSAVTGDLADGAVTKEKVGFNIGGGNILINSSAENGTVGWSAYAGSLAAQGAAGAPHDENVFLVRANAAVSTSQAGGSNNSFYPVPANEKVVISAWVKTPVGRTTVTLIARDDTNNSTWGSVDRTVPANTWTRVTWATTVPADRRLERIYVVPLTSITGGNLVTNEEAWFDAVQLERGDVATAYAPKPDEILPSTITSTELADNAVTTPKLIAGAVVAGKIAAGAVETDKLAANAVVADKIAANAITVTKIAAGAVVADKIAAGAVVADKIAAGSIASDKIVVAGLDAAVVKFGVMSGDRISANTLSAAAIKTSTLTAADVTIDGGQLKVGTTPGSPTNGQGLILNSQGISLYKSDGVRTVFLDALTGTATFTGTISGSTITGGVVNGATIRGGLIRTTDTNPWRVELNSTSPNSILFFTGEPGETAGEVRSNWFGDGVTQQGVLTLHPPTFDDASKAKTAEIVMMTKSRNSLTGAGMVFSLEGSTFSPIAKEFSFIGGSGSKVHIGPSSLAQGVGVRMDANGGWFRTHLADTGLYNEAKLTGVFFPSQNEVWAYPMGQAKFIARRNGWFWSDAPLRSEATGNSDCAIGWHQPGAKAISMWFSAVNGDLRVHRNDSAFGTITAVINNVSSERYKRNVRDALVKGEGRKKLRAARPIRFKRTVDTTLTVDGQPAYDRFLQECAEGVWRPEAKAESDASLDREVLGFSAEELNGVIPEAVTLDEQGLPMALDYSQITPVLWQAAKEQDEVIEAMSARLKSVESRLSALEARR